MDNLKTNVPRLETERLILRRFEPGDMDAILAIVYPVEFLRLHKRQIKSTAL